MSKRKILTSVISCWLLSAIAPLAVYAHGGHGDEFNHTETNPESIEVDAATALSLGIKLQTISKQKLDMGIKTTGEIENPPNQQAEVTTPIPGIVAQLLVEPGDRVTQGQPVAVISSPDLLQLRVDSQDRRTEADADLTEAKANLQLAEQNLTRERQIAATEIASARIKVEEAEERYNRDGELETQGALPRRQMLESKTQLAEAKNALEKAMSTQNVLEAEAELKRAQAAVEAATTNLQLSDATYQTRLQQLSTPANEQGLVTVFAPISGTVAHREVTLGSSFEDAGGQLMLIVNNSQVWAVANVYEKDLDKVQIGQKVRVKVPSLPEQTFTGKITQIAPVVEGETRVIPVRAKLDNPGEQLKPGMFAQLEILTNTQSALAIPSSAVVEANGKQLVYLENGQNVYEPVEVTLSNTFGDWVEVTKGLFEGDRLVVEGTMMLYAQSLRGTKAPKNDHETSEKTPEINRVNLGWVAFPLGGTILLGAFMLGRASNTKNNA